MNKWIFMGRICADITNEDIRYTSGDNATCITNFRIAVDKGYKNKNNPDAPTADFFRIVCFGRTAEFAKDYLKKGTKVVVEGRVENNNYKNADGQMVYRDQYIADRIEFAESKKAAESNNNTNNNGTDTKFDFPTSDLESDLPF